MARIGVVRSVPLASEGPRLPRCAAFGRHHELACCFFGVLLSACSGDPGSPIDGASHAADAADETGPEDVQTQPRGDSLGARDATWVADVQTEADSSDAGDATWPLSVQPEAGDTALDAMLVPDVQIDVGDPSDAGDATWPGLIQPEAGDDAFDAMLVPDVQVEAAEARDALDATVEIDGVAQAPAPRIVAADLGTIAPSGVLIVKVDVSNGATFDSVVVGSASIGLSDPNAFRWLNQSDPANSVFALRMPADLATGTASLRLQGSAAQSAPYTLAVISPSLRAPAASAGIVFAPTKAADDPFPVSSSSPFPQQDMQAPNPNMNQPYWMYDLHFHDEAGAGTTCARRGQVSGEEHGCPATSADSGFGFNCGRSNRCYSDADGVVCNALTGSYSLSVSENRVDLSIDRMAPEGPEHYVGGWAQADGSAPVSTVGAEFLVLRSLRTGMVLTIKHSFQAAGLMGCSVPPKLDASTD